MNTKFLLTKMCLLFLFVASAHQQAFETFAIKQDSLFIKAYQQRDVAAYQQLLYDFTAKYVQLNKLDQKQFIAYAQNAYSNLSCTYALPNRKPEAIEYLQKSVAVGYSNYSHLQEDKDFDNIRHEKAFRQISASLWAVGDYLYILQGTGRYNPGDSRKLPVFTYQSANNPNLLALRKGFNLDSVAGQGNDISKMINLMHWVHNLIPHDGNHSNPVVKKAVSFIAACKKDNLGLNYCGLATVPNKCYLAMGFKSRFVTCLPKESLKIDLDCHVINKVFEPILKKWLWMDPTNDAYVMNEKGEMLSIEEVRQRILSDKPIILNATANWYNKVSKTKADYLYQYMAKNLYLLQCKANSQCNTETSINGKSFTYITLVPTAYFKQVKNTAEVKGEVNKLVYRYY